MVHKMLWPQPNPARHNDTSSAISASERGIWFWVFFVLKANFVSLMTQFKYLILHIRGIKVGRLQVSKKLMLIITIDCFLWYIHYLL